MLDKVAGPDEALQARWLESQRRGTVSRLSTLTSKSSNFSSRSVTDRRKHPSNGCPLLLEHLT